MAKYIPSPRAETKSSNPTMLKIIHPFRFGKKQKMKIQGYQERIKSEAEQIQELIALGIDPQSLM